VHSVLPSSCEETVAAVRSIGSEEGTGEVRGDGWGEGGSMAVEVDLGNLPSVRRRLAIEALYSVECWRGLPNYLRAAAPVLTERLRLFGSERRSLFDRFRSGAKG
jgi:hypothetical protein